jgi:hypothetical protein
LTAVSFIAVPGGSTQPFGISETFFGGGHSAPFWRVYPEAAILVDLLLSCVPTLAIAFHGSPSRAVSCSGFSATCRLGVHDRHRGRNRGNPDGVAEPLPRAVPDGVP